MAILEGPVKGVPKIKNYVDGEWVESKGDVMDVVNPVTCETIARVGISTREEIDDAVQAAKEAYVDWRRTPPCCQMQVPPKIRPAIGREF
jgi:malonate-semialdehyde dehydrogenase (acetylating) / methylmalonate-semialdehyde dehydrogenase